MGAVAVGMKASETMLVVSPSSRVGLRSRLQSRPSLPDGEPR